MPTSYTLPSTQSVTLQLPQPAIGGSVAWTEAPALGTVSPATDGQSALFTPGTTAITLTQVLVNSAESLTLASVAASSGGTAAYTGTITGGGSNAFANMVFVITGFQNSVNNGTFMCTASTTSILTLTNNFAVIEAHAATATASASNASYLGTIGGATNSLATLSAVITGFATAANNGTFTILASSTTSFGVLNASAANVTAAGKAVVTGVTATTVTATITQGSKSWRPGTLYRLNDTIVDVNGHVQKVTAAAAMIPTVYTPLASDIPQGGIATYLQTFALSSVANSSGLTAVYSGTITGGSSNAYIGQTFTVAGFITNASNNGTFICTASSGSTLTLFNSAAISETPTLPPTARSLGFANDPQGYSRLLQQGQGDINGDWPAGALGIGANTNLVATATNLKVVSTIPTTAAPVSYVLGGYSSGANPAGRDKGGSQGINTPQSYGNNSTYILIAPYSETEYGNFVQYKDAQGNLHTTGWQIAGSTQTFTETANTVPTFSTTGGTTVEGDLTWTDQGAGSTLETYAINITLSSSVQAPYGNYAVLG